MVYPITNYKRIKVRGHFVDLAKAAREETSYGVLGPVQFIPMADVAVNRDGTPPQIIDMKPFVVFPDAQDGYFEVLLPATDDPDVVPTDFSYKVVEPTGRAYLIKVPHDTPPLNLPGDPDHNTPVIDLADIVPDPSNPGGTVQLLQGRPGRDVTSVEMDEDRHLIVTFSDNATQDAGEVWGVTSVNSRIGDITLTKSDVGLSNVDNTSDLDKPISTAVQSALDGKANTSHNHSASQINSGTLNIARIPTGTSSSTVALGNHTHSGMVSSSDINTIEVLTQSEYDNLGTKDSNTLYVVI